MPQPVAWGRVVKACPRINSTEYRLWDEYRFMEGGAEGCFARTDVMARRCGLTVRQIEDARANLVAYGLLVSEQDRAREGRAARIRWWVALPEPCYPPDRPSDREVFRLADLLAGLIGEAVSARRGIPKKRDEPIPENRDD